MKQQQTAGTSAQVVLILDFGGQYSQLIARRVRECQVYCEVLSYRTPLETILQKHPIGIILSGGPNSVYAPDAPSLPSQLFSCGIPILGICYGAQLMAASLGGTVSPATDLSPARSDAPAGGEYGKTQTHFVTSSSIFSGIAEEGVTWMSHFDAIAAPPPGFTVLAKTEHCAVAAMGDEQRRLFALQFHPEVNHTTQGERMLKNFLFGVCGAAGDWTMTQFVERAIEDIRQQVGAGKVLLALSGGVDSSVLAALLSKAIGPQLTCIFVDHGLMRKQEGAEIADLFSTWEMNFVAVDASQQFFAALSGVSDPEQKRKIIGAAFITVFEAEAKRIGAVDFLAQGTIYPDVIESGHGEAAVIKSHHNVGGLPDHVDFKAILEPLRMLFKDEVRQLGLALGLSEQLVFRQPFPGPGLAVRIIGEITPEKVARLQQADAIYREEIARAGLDRQIHQYFAVLTSMQSVGVMGDARTYEDTLALRAVETSDFMTADFARIPYDVLEKVATRIVNEVGHINRIVYDITTKPPATIEWE